MQPPPFHGTEWLKLETAIEIIGDLIAHHTARLNKAVLEGAEDHTLAQIEREIKRLSRERLECYNKDTNQLVIEKALTQYALLLKSLKQT